MDFELNPKYLVFSSCLIINLVQFDEFKKKLVINSVHHSLARFYFYFSKCNQTTKFLTKILKLTKKIEFFLIKIKSKATRSNNFGRKFVNQTDFFLFMSIKIKWKSQVIITKKKIFYNYAYSTRIKLMGFEFDWLAIIQYFFKKLELEINLNFLFWTKNNPLNFHFM